MKTLIMAATIAAALAVSPAFADEAVVLPDHHDTTVIHENDRRSDDPVIVEKTRPDAVIVDHDRRYSNGGSSGEVGVGVGGVGVDVKTHGHDHDRPK